MNVQALAFPVSNGQPNPGVPILERRWFHFVDGFLELAGAGSVLAPDPAVCRGMIAGASWYRLDLNPRRKDRIADGHWLRLLEDESVARAGSGSRVPIQSV